MTTTNDIKLTIHKGGRNHFVRSNIKMSIKFFITNLHKHNLIIFFFGQIFMMLVSETVTVQSDYRIVPILFTVK